MAIGHGKLLRAALVIVCAAVLFSAYGRIRDWRRAPQPAAIPETQAPLSMPRATEEIHGLPNYDWRAPQAQDPDGSWTYELFTPPAVELRNGRFRVIDSAAAAFQLLRLEEIPYRLRLEGFVRKTDGSVGLFVRDVETGQLELVSEGAASRKGNFFVERCDFRTNPEKTIRVALLRDGRDGRTRHLLLGSPGPVEKFHIEVLSDRHGLRERHCLRNLGEKIVHGDRSYELVGAEAAANTVRLSPTDFPERAFSLQLSAGETVEGEDPAAICSLGGL
ncbi:MAG: hypothetical protein LBF24_01245 [Puniceicoccales bacterium]|nr:hypothetical protein [Puniceicoccales bacterium]